MANIQNVRNKNDLPQYKSHKIIRAFKIAEIIIPNAVENRLRLVHTDVILKPEDTSLPTIMVGKHYVLKHDPRVGGYYVLYPDGYESYSPAKAFEDGYFLIPNTITNS